MSTTSKSRRDTIKLAEYEKDLKQKGSSKFNDYLLNKTDGSYTLLTSYTRAKDKVTMRHEECNYTWEVTPDNFMRRHSRCPKCKGNPRFTTAQFKEHMKETIGDEHVFHGEYVNARTKILCEHKLCGSKWWVKPYALKQGVICPTCAESSGERIVRLILEELGINYEQQATFDGCRTKRLLPFDFYLPLYNIVIEYDGVQHFEPVDFGNKGKEHAQNSFLALKQRDKLKDTFCSSNEIAMLRIPYTDSSFEIKEKILSKLASTQK